MKFALFFGIVNPQKKKNEPEKPQQRKTVIE
jgi:hypothetical protein